MDSRRHPGAFAVHRTETPDQGFSLGAENGLCAAVAAWLPDKSQAAEGDTNQGTPRHLEWLLAGCP